MKIQLLLLIPVLLLLNSCGVSTKTTKTTFSSDNTITTFEDSLVSIPKDSAKFVKDIVPVINPDKTIDIKPDTAIQGDIEVITQTHENKRSTKVIVAPKPVLLKAVIRETKEIKLTETEIVKVEKPGIWQRIKNFAFEIIIAAITFSVLWLAYRFRGLFKT